MCGSRLFLRGEGLKSKPLKQTIETLTMDFSEGSGWGLKQKIFHERSMDIIYTNTMFHSGNLI